MKNKVFVTDGGLWAVLSYSPDEVFYFHGAVFRRSLEESDGNLTIGYEVVASLGCVSSAIQNQFLSMFAPLDDWRYSEKASSEYEVLSNWMAAETVLDW